MDCGPFVWSHYILHVDTSWIIEKAPYAVRNRVSTTAGNVTTSADPRELASAHLGLQTVQSPISNFTTQIPDAWSVSISSHQ